MTKLLGILDRSVVRFSVIPSAKYSCAGSPVMLAKGNTTMEKRGAPGGIAGLVMYHAAPATLTSKTTHAAAHAASRLRRGAAVLGTAAVGSTPSKRTR